MTTERGLPAFYAAGFGGQFIEVVPDLDLVVVVTSGWDHPNQKSRSMIAEFAVAAVGVA